MEAILSQDAVPVLSLSGKLDTAHTSIMEGAIAPILSGDIKEVIVDCKNLDYISSSGLRQFLVLQKNISSKKGSLKIRNMRPEIKEIFDLTGFSTIFNIEA